MAAALARRGPARRARSACYRARVVARILLVLALLLAFGQASGMPVLGDTCGEDCPDGKQCPPLCPTCACASASLPSVPAPVAVMASPLAPAPRVLVFAVPAPSGLSPDPREILHVPRSLTV